MPLRRLTLIPLALALVLGACSSDDSSSSSGSEGTNGAATSAAAGTTGAASGTLAPAPEGFTVVDRRADGFVIALPPGWQDFDLTEADVDAIIAAATQANPNLGNGVADAVKQLVQQGGLLYASDTSNPGKFLTNVNLIKVAGVESGLGLLQQQAQSQLTAAGATNVSTTQVSLPGGDAIRTTYTVPVTLADGSKVDIAGLQVYMLANENLYVLTFSTDQPDKYSETFDQVIATFAPS
jgi:hypothetical protein